MEYRITLPASDEELKKLRAGDRVLLSGRIYTARDAAHKRLIELIEAGLPLPVELEGAAVYYAGPTPEKPGKLIGSVGPTTSGRMDPYAAALLDRGLKIMIGKGKRSDGVTEAIVRNGAVYLAAPGGAGALMGGCVLEAETLCYEDLGCEAIRCLEVRDMPLTVATDSLGTDIYKTGPRAYLESLKKD